LRVGSLSTTTKRNSTPPRSKRKSGQLVKHKKKPCSQWEKGKMKFFYPVCWGYGSPLADVEGHVLRWHENPTTQFKKYTGGQRASSGGGVIQKGKRSGNTEPVERVPPLIVHKKAGEAGYIHESHGESRGSFREKSCRKDILF